MGQAERPGYSNSRIRVALDHIKADVSRWHRQPVLVECVPQGLRLSDRGV